MRLILEKWLSNFSWYGCTKQFHDSPIKDSFPFIYGNMLVGIYEANLHDCFRKNTLFYRNLAMGHSLFNYAALKV